MLTRWLACYTLKDSTAQVFWTWTLKLLFQHGVSGAVRMTYHVCLIHISIRLWTGAPHFPITVGRPSKICYFFLWGTATCWVTSWSVNCDFAARLVVRLGLSEGENSERVQSLLVKHVAPLKYMKPINFQIALDLIVIKINRTKLMNLPKALKRRRRDGTLSRINL